MDDFATDFFNIVTLPIYFLWNLLNAFAEWFKILIFGPDDFLTRQEQQQRRQRTSPVARLLNEKSDHEKPESQPSLPTPEELFDLKLAQGEFNEALAIADAYTLDIDRVFQTQWLKNPVTTHTIEQYLRKIKSRKWAVGECSRRVGESAEVCRELLKLGLDLTNFLKSLAREELLNEENQYYIKQRQKFLKYLDRLEDYEESRLCEIHFENGNKNFDKKFYLKIRNFSELDLALYFARHSHFLSLNRMFNRYRSKLHTCWLVILSNIGETVDVDKYKSLLPCEDSHQKLWHDRIYRGKDFLERRDVFEDFVVRTEGTFETAHGSFVLKESHYSDNLRRVFGEWYEHRALQIEQFTGLPHLAEKLVNAAIDIGYYELTLVSRDMRFLRELVYSGQIENPISYQKFLNVPPMELADQYLKEKTGDCLGQTVFELVVPYFKYYETRHSDETTASRLFYDYMIHLSKSSMEPFYSILKFFEAHRKEVENVFATRENLMHLADDCFNVCENENVAENIQTSFKVVALLAGRRMCNVSITTSKILSSINNHLKALETLNLFGIAYSYAKFKRLTNNVDDSVLLLKRLARKFIENTLHSTATGIHSAARFVGSPNFHNVLKTMNQLRRSVLTVVPSVKCCEIFVEALLTSNDIRAINASLEFIDDLSAPPDKEEMGGSEGSICKLPFQTAQQVVLSAGVSYVNESTGVDDKALDYAQICFNLLKPQSDEIRRELDFVNALPLLDSCGVKDLPLRLRMYVDRSRLVDDIFDKNDEIYKELTRLISICRLLRVPSSDETEVRCYVTRRCAENALARNDIPICVSYCVSLMRSRDVKAWKVFRDLARNSNCDSRVRCNLFEFCLCYCDSEELPSILSDYQRVKHSQLVTAF